LPAFVDHKSRRILLPISGIVGAVTMPIALGHQVLAGLRVRLQSGPVVEHLRSQRWIFLTGPGHALADSMNADLLRLRPSVPSLRDPGSYQLLTELLKLGTSIASPGDYVVLPSPQDEQLGRQHWVHNLKPLSDLPPQSAVIATTRAVAAAAAAA
jgi:hypothetical protein